MKHDQLMCFYKIIQRRLPLYLIHENGHLEKTTSIPGASLLCASVWGICLVLAISGFGATNTAINRACVPQRFKSHWESF
jgi:hypothetical protein